MNTKNQTIVHKTIIAPELIQEILKNPNVDGFSLNYERLGEKENLRLEVKRLNSNKKQNVPSFGTTQNYSIKVIGKENDKIEKYKR